MCVLVYIASDHELPLIPWKEDAPAFCVGALAPDEARVRAQFSKANLYHLGSHEGCGCGFQHGEYPDFDDDENDKIEREKRRNSCRQLSEYLSLVVQKFGEVEIFACWDGDQEAPISGKERVSPEYFASPSFYFKEKQLLIVSGKGA